MNAELKETGGTCPRRVYELGPWTREEGNDGWRADRTCTFCGSLNPDDFMARLEEGDVQLTPTDKGYKVYVSSIGPTTSGSLMAHRKFYFQHLSAEQRARFVTLLNERRLHLAYPHYFYVLPYFIKL